MPSPSSKTRELSKAVLPAAGKGTRMRPLTHLFPKEMVPVGRKPTVQHVLEEALEAGLSEILVILGPDKLATAAGFHTAVADEEHVELSFAVQHPPAGLGDAVLRARAWVGEESFAVLLADPVMESGSPPSTLKRLLDVHRRRRAAATLLLERVPRRMISRYGVVAPRGAGRDTVFRIDHVVEKPPAKEAPSDLAIAGRYVFAPEIFDALTSLQPGAQSEIQLTDAIEALCRQGRPVYGVRMNEGDRRHDIGDFETYFRAFFDFACGDAELGESFRTWARRRLKQGC
jgi:UTP--glucose-1-phosphate uridylyltransferase